MKFLTDEQLAELSPAETASFPSPVPTQIVSSDEYLPVPQTDKQRQVEARLKEMSSRLARRQGLSRRRFFQTASGMAASFVAMNEVFGPVFDATPAEAATPELANERAAALSGQFIIDGHTHFLRDDTRLAGFAKMRNAFGKLGWNKELTADRPSTTLNLPTISKRSIWTATPRWRCCRIRRRTFHRIGLFRRPSCSKPAPRSTRRPGRGACWRISRSPPGNPAGSTRSIRRSRCTNPIRGRAIRSATTRIRSLPTGRGMPTTKS